MDGKINLYGRARRIALMRTIIIISLSIGAVLFVISKIFSKEEVAVIHREYAFLTEYFTDINYNSL